MPPLFFSFYFFIFLITENFGNIPLVEDKIFTSHDFISLVTRTTSTLSWIFGKSTLKPRIAHIYTK